MPLYDYFNDSYLSDNCNVKLIYVSMAELESYKSNVSGVFLKSSLATF